VVIGIGMNVALGAPLLERIAQTGTAATDLATSGLAQPSRNAVVAGLIASCLQGLLDFEREGLKPFIGEWRKADALRGRPVTVQAQEGPVSGVARGVDTDGALIVETPQGLRRFISGDVSVRATA
jgi:BirA family biotin operon repressor/biotin-[acetyl-CoA-carboxylase] ligase